MESYSYKQSIANTMDRSQSFEDQNNDDSQSMSGHAKRDQFSKFEPKFDIMNIVMKRRVGGSSEEDSPLKKRKTENSIDSERSQCITGTKANENGKSNVAVDTAGGPDKLETRIAGDVNLKQRFDTDPQCNSHDTNHSKAFRGLESKENKLNRSEDDLVERSDNIEHEHISSMNRSELSTSFEKAFGTESPDRNHTLNHTLSKHFATNEDKDNPAKCINYPAKCNNNPAKCINNPDKCNKSFTSEIRLKIPPKVYRNHTNSGDSKKQCIDNIRKADEGGDEESGTDETDGDATSNANKGFGDDTGLGEVASSYFSSHLNHVSKKSRKQTIPKKINRPCRDEVGTNRPEIESETSAVGPEFENKLTSLNETYNSSLDSSYALDMDFLQKSECQNILRDKGQLSHEKSRKQSISKRKIDQLAVLPNFAGKKEIEKPMLNGTYSSAEQKHVKCRKQNTPRKIVQEFSIADSVSSSKGKVYDEDIRSCNVDNQDIEDFLSEDSKESLASNPNVDNTSANPDHTDDHTNIFTSPYFPNIDLEKPEKSFVTPELARLSQQIALQAELLAKLSQNHIQLTESFNNDSAPSARGGLEFVKKLREVRVNRYRKISIDVKKHIAGFAKVHGVSVAANHFGVSKSAVSLWNRTDFTEKDEELEKRKRNCFIGNEKFENLVQRVKLEKATKFKYLSREDKVEVAKYAKLVGVREMSRCLNMALGTVSGWMRQYPYDVVAKTETVPADVKKCDDELGNIQIPNDMKAMIDKSSLMNDKECEVSVNIPVKPECNANIPRDTIDNELEECGSYKLKEYDNFNTHVKDSLLKGSDQKSDFYEKHGEYNYERLMSSSVSNESETNGFHPSESSKDLNSKILKLSAESENDNQHNNVEMAVTENSRNMKQNVALGIDHDLESLIASSFVKPDLDKCFAEVKEQIVGTVLEDDAYFEHLFKRVTETRIDKYKSLKRSEKLEIVRYAKRIGVRRVAKIMDLATGTLSGWIIKYQHLLGLVSNVNADNHVDSSNQSDIEVDTGNVSATTESEITQITENQEKHVNLLLQSPSSILDNKDSTEVTALKFLLKERFPLLQEKINVARKVKFKNLNIGEKLELVKCAKLVGIRPTARVFQMPLGTLSGWISKYSCFLEPEFHGVSQGSAICATSNTWLINRLDNSLGRLNESDNSTGVSLRTAPHLQWTAAEDRSDETDRSESPYSKMMNEMAEKSFSNTSHLFPSGYNADIINSQTNILNRRLSVDWPKLSSQQSSDLSWPRLKLPNGQTEDIRVSNPDNESPHFLLHGYNDSFNEESTKAMAQQYMKQFGMVQFADT